MYSKHLGLSAKYWGLSPFLRVPLSIFDVQPFTEEALKLRTNLLSLSLPRELLSFFLPPYQQIILAVSDLVSRLIFYYDDIWRFSSGYCSSPKVPCFQVAPKLSEGLIGICKRCPGKSYPWLLLLLFSDK